MRLISDKTIDDLIYSLGLEFFPKEKKREILTRILELISKRAGLRIIEKFSEEETAEFNKIPKENLEKMENYLLSKNANAKDIFEEEARKVKEEILNAEIEKL